MDFHNFNEWINAFCPQYGQFQSPRSSGLSESGPLIASVPPSPWGPDTYMYWQPDIDGESGRSYSFRPQYPRDPYPQTYPWPSDAEQSPSWLPQASEAYPEEGLVPAKNTPVQQEFQQSREVKERKTQKKPIKRPLQRQRKPRKSPTQNVTVNLAEPLSKLIKHVPSIPAIDMTAHVNRGVAERQREAFQNGRIKAPVSNFLLYRAAHKDLIFKLIKLGMLDDKQSSESAEMNISRICGASWRMESQEIRDQYREWARIDVDNHHLAFPDHTGLCGRPSTGKRRVPKKAPPRFV
ncbi:hypothetical protein F5Y13DRAFT_186293 [Hypoxylon sp. FL1857]|nr:hypothetical protein F5Y13DRAFT_186293 [Hypoxylon sp. FL1857]